MDDNRKQTIFRFAVIFFIFCAGFLVVLLRIIQLQTVDKNRWLKFADQQVSTDRVVPAIRGNILDAEGQLLCSSMPQYYVYMDAGVAPLHQGGDTLLHRHIDQLCRDLYAVIGGNSPEEYKTKIIQAHKSRRRSLRVSPIRINYLQRKRLEENELIRRGKNVSGFTFKEDKRRIKLLGDMASRSLGSIDAETGKGKTGLEARYNDLLTGTDGLAVRKKIAGRYQDVTIEEAIDGLDIQTTIDANLQDVVSSALLARLELTEADWGCCVLMETKTGHIKAIANLDRNSDGSYTERFNHAVTLMEPGSTFKTVALMAALDDDKVEIDDTITVSKAPWRYFSVTHTDSHERDTIYTMRGALAASSNIALAKIITRGYEGSASKFIKRIRRLGIMDEVYCEIPGAQSSLIKVPNDTVTLSKMSYGYSVLLTPLQLLMFYNAIANDGKMVRPQLVTDIWDGKRVVEHFDSELVRSSICKKSTLVDIRSALHDVVWDNNIGTASVNKWHQRKAQSDLVSIAGKTGTAQLLINGKYHKKHRMTFVGYFPEQNPQYSCICVINYPHCSAYDSGMDCGRVVRQIAEKTIANVACYQAGDQQHKLIKR